ncbi:MAG: acyl-CoA dehydrogenase family protein [Myxococcaceae bacterium]|nr:acyl-CoA dehydrogenase family protein [Myxococcaceae bacterium]
MNGAPARGGSFLWEEAGTREVMAPERFTEDQRALARSARDFSNQEILPRIQELEAKKPGLMPTLLKKAGELGVLMVDIPTEYGGLGLGKIASMLLAEQFSRLGSFSVSLGAHTGIGTMPIVYFGTEAQKQKYLPLLATGQKLAAYALTEPSSGSDALAAKTRAVKSADGKHWVLNGSKQFITNAGFADVFTVFAKVDGEKFTGFIVDRETPGLVVGPEEHKMGIRGSSTCTLSFEDAKIPIDAVLGEIGKGHKIAFNTLNIGRMKLGIGTVGASKYALELAAKYAKERQQFGKPIGSFGLVANKLAEMALAIFVGETIGYRTIGLVEDALQSAHTPAEKIDAIEEFSVEASIIKFFGSEVLSFCADEAVQIHGGYGFIEDYDVARIFRDSRINRIFEGTNEINRLIVPGTLLKRAVKGQIPLMEQSLAVRERLQAGDIPRAKLGAFGVERQVAEFCKWITLYVMQVAGETYHVNVAEEQEILGEIADMVARTYALDSVVQRVSQIAAGSDERRARIAREFLTAYAPRAYGFVVHTGRHVLMDICDPANLNEHLDLLNKLRMDWPTKVIEAKRRLAKEVLESDGYPLDELQAP